SGHYSLRPPVQGLKDPELPAFGIRDVLKVPAGASRVAPLCCGHRRTARQPDRDAAPSRWLVALCLAGMRLRHGQVSGEQFDELTAAPDRRVIRWAGFGCLRTPGASRDQVAPAGI